MVRSMHARRRVPYPGPILAGTVPCPGCDGNPVVHRHTPDFMRIAGQNETFHTIVRARLASSASCWLVSDRSGALLLCAPCKVPGSWAPAVKHMGAGQVALCMRNICKCCLAVPCCWGHADARCARARQTTKRRGRFRRQAPEVIERVRPREYFEYPRQRPFNPEGSAFPGPPASP